MSATRPTPISPDPEATTDAPGTPHPRGRHLRRESRGSGPGTARRLFSHLVPHRKLHPLI